MEAKRIGSIAFGIFALGFSAWFLKIVYGVRGELPLLSKLFFISVVTASAFGILEEIRPKNGWKAILPMFLITCLIVLPISPRIGFSENADVSVVLMSSTVSDELMVVYTIPLDNETRHTIKTYESKPGWKFIILEFFVNNNADRLREYSNGWFETKEGIVYHSYTVEDAGCIASCEGNGSYSIMPVELKPDDGITTRTAVQVPSNEAVSNLYFVYKIQGDDLKYGEFGRIKMSR